MDDFDFENRIVSTDATSEDNENEVSLRPFDMDEYIGQEKAKEILKIYIDAVKLRGDYLDHVLLYGPPGLGKTTLSGIIAAELGVNFRVTSGPAIEKQGDLAALLTNSRRGRCSVYQRDTSPFALDRGDFVSGDGGLFA